MSGKNEKGNVMGNYLKYLEILNLIEKDYVDTVNTDELVEYSINKMFEKLDPHTTYIPKRELDLAKSQLEGSFEGIGIEFNIIKDTIYVVTPISGGPSEQVGLQAGDKIIKVNGENVAGTNITTMEVFKKLRGKKGTEVRVSIMRKGVKNLLEYKIIRDKIPTYSVDASYMIDKETGYIKVSKFSENTYIEFKQALRKLLDKGMTQLILDLKDNPGGYMQPAIEMADEFISGDKMIVYTDGKGTKYDEKYRAGNKGEFEKNPLIVLINEGSASASEIVSGALQDNDRALIVGRRSFGKGLVGRQIPLSDQSEIRLTISRYYTPSGRCIQKPYEKNDLDKYHFDLANRYQKGEFFHADSIKFADSLKYKTSKGRTVYGGGGIMPDYFVPRDTSELTEYLFSLFNNNVIREYTINFYTSNKNLYKDVPFDKFNATFEVSDQMLSELVALAEKSGVKYKESEFNKSKNYLKTNIKAYIARSFYGNEGFYQIINQTDEIYIAALKQFSKARQLLKMK
ncbi:MAG: S41 family peptidase [Cytophagaceae bacterium]|nr:S41 family peptidase [Cytophagaceae bacterium]